MGKMKIDIYFIADILTVFLEMFVEWSFTLSVQTVVMATKRLGLLNK